MNPTLKTALVYTAKNAVNAILVALPTLKIDPAKFHLHSWAGADHILEVMAGAVIAREAGIWLPKLLAWSNTPNVPPTGGQGNVAIGSVTR